MAFLSKFLKKIGLFFKGLFNAAKKAYENLPEEQQQALLQGSGVIALINDMYDDAPDLIISAIREKFPNLPLDTVMAGINEALKGFGIDAGQTLVGAIEKLKEKLHIGEGKTWAATSEMAAKFFAIVVAPKDMKYARIAALMEYVYQTFIKK